MFDDKDSILNGIPSKSKHEENRSIFGPVTGNILDTYDEDSITVKKEGCWTQFLDLNARVQKRMHYVVFGICAGLLLLQYVWLFYAMIIQLVKIEEYLMPLGLILPISLICFNFVHSIGVLGFPFAVIWLIVVLLYTYVAETIGVWTGWLYGSYHYTNLISAHIGYVPVSVPFSWYMMLWPSFCLADLITHGEPHTRLRKGQKLKVAINIVTCAIITSIIMVGWDVVADPQGSTLSSIWVWENPNGYFYGVPLLNFLGWFMTVFPLVAGLMIVEVLIPPFFPVLYWMYPLAFLSILSFLSFTLFYIVLSFPVDLTLVAFFTMGIPVFFGCLRLGYGAIHAPSIVQDSTFMRNINYDEIIS